MLDIVVLGLGRVGSRNAEKPGLEKLSHVGAILASGGYRLLGLVDPDETARAVAANTWSGQAVGVIAASVAEVGAVSADVVVIAGATEAREAQFDAALSLRPRVLLVEKPLAANSIEGKRFADIAMRSGAALRVNFNRRFDPGHVRVKESLKGTPRKAVMRYGKGLRNYASHMIDLLLDWYGPIETVQALGAEQEGDGPLDFRCRLAVGFDAVVVGFDGLGYDQFEIDLFYADERIELADGGVAKRQYRAIQDRVYPGYAHLTDEPEILHDGIVGGFVETYRAIGRHLTDGTPLGGCGPDAALAGLAALDAALLSAARGGAVVRPDHMIAAR